MWVVGGAEKLLSLLFVVRDSGCGIVAVVEVIVFPVVGWMGWSLRILLAGSFLRDGIRCLKKRRCFSNKVPTSSSSGSVSKSVTDDASPLPPPLSLGAGGGGVVGAVVVGNAFFSWRLCFPVWAMPTLDAGSAS